MTVNRGVLSIGSRDASSLLCACMCLRMEAELGPTSRPLQIVQAWESRQWSFGWANSAEPSWQSWLRNSCFFRHGSESSRASTPRPPTLFCRSRSPGHHPRPQACSEGQGGSRASTPRSRLFCRSRGLQGIHAETIDLVLQAKIDSRV